MLLIQNPDQLKIPDSLHGGGLVLPHGEYIPEIGLDVYAVQACVISRTFLCDRVNIWFGSVIRGDIAEIGVGEDTNIQDLCILHVSTGMPCIVGNRVTVGHRAILHACTLKMKAWLEWGRQSSMVP
jgi:carbonic anhydrase/acetyltransferase-like protein (isoleucine patch superfamily)